MWWSATRIKRKRALEMDSWAMSHPTIIAGMKENRSLDRYLWMFFFSHQPERTCLSKNKVRIEVVRQNYIKTQEKTPFIALPTLAQPIYKRQVTLQWAILQTKQTNEALQVAQEGKGNVFQHPIHSNIKHQQNLHKGRLVWKGKEDNA